MEHNPYEAPITPIVESVRDLISDERPSEERDFRIFVGSRAHYYLRRWAPALTNQGASSGFNWAAFFFAGFWLPYRKMYRATGLLYLYAFSMTIGQTLLLAQMPEAQKNIDGFGGIFGLAVTIYVAFQSNAWYLAHAKRTISEIKTQQLPDETYQAELARRGGTSWLAGFGMFTLLILGFVVIGFVEELFASGL